MVLRLRPRAHELQRRLRQHDYSTALQDYESSVWNYPLAGRITAWHIVGALASSNVTHSQWHCILQHASDRSVFWKPDSAGDTCVDSFVLSWFTPCFSTAVQQVMESPTLWSQLQRQLEQPQSKTPIDRRVTLVAHFWTSLQALFRAADPEPSILSVLTRLQVCPEALGRLATRLDQDSVHQPDAQGRLPLHQWANTPADRVDDALLIPLLEAYPEAALLPDAQGRVPLQLALAHKPLAHIRYLLVSAPGALALCREPFFVHVALAGRRLASQRRKMAAKRSQSASLHEWLDAATQNEWTTSDRTEVLTLIYQSLRACPSAILDVL